jgi:hypothetical protein
MNTPPSPFLHPPGPLAMKIKKKEKKKNCKKGKEAADQ